MDKLECPACGATGNARGKPFDSEHSVKVHHYQQHDESLVDEPEYADVECPTCGREDFQSKNGMRTHHTKTHGESLINNYDNDAECPSCGRTDFQSERGMHQHHTQMHGESLVYTTKECSWCGGDKRIAEYRVDSQEKFFCSEDHCHEWMRNNLKGENALFYGKEHTEETKQKMSEAAEGRGGEDHHWYGRNHTEETKRKIGEGNKGTNTGKDHPLWKGGASKKFSKAFHRNRSKVRERDDYECRLCGMSKEEHYELCKRDHHVHHITPRSEFMEDGMKRPPDEAGAMSNLISLCQKCHKTAEHHPSVLNDVEI